MNVKSCGTKTRVIPTVIIVKPPATIPTAVARRQARPIPIDEFKDKGADGLKRVLKGAGFDNSVYERTSPMMKKGRRRSVPVPCQVSR
jgi:threonyl-tRNA synthetase